MNGFATYIRNCFSGYPKPRGRTMGQEDRPESVRAISKIASYRNHVAIAERIERILELADSCMEDIERVGRGPMLDDALREMMSHHALRQLLSLGRVVCKIPEPEGSPDVHSSGRSPTALSGPDLA